MFIKRLPAILILSLVFSAAAAYSQKLSAEEIVARHLDSIAAKETRSQIKNQISVGDTVVNFVSQKTPPLLGRIVLVSEGKKNFFGLKLNSTDYPSERFSFDGKKVKVGFVRTGSRSILGNFLLSNENIFTDGLLGGTLSNAWVLLDTGNTKPKIALDGTKKIEGREAYVLSYLQKGDLNIKMYFDRENFQHLRTEYKRVSSAGIGRTPEESSRFYESRISLTEDFSNYKKEKGVNLPHKYRLAYSISGQNGTTEIVWNFTLNEFAFNMNLTADTFDAEAN